MVAGGAMSNKFQSKPSLKSCFNWTLPEEVMFSFISKPGVHLKFYIYDLQDGWESFLNFPQTGGIRGSRQAPRTEDGFNSPSFTVKRNKMSIVEKITKGFLLFKGLFPIYIYFYKDPLVLRSHCWSHCPYTTRWRQIAQRFCCSTNELVGTHRCKEEAPQAPLTQSHHLIFIWRDSIICWKGWCCACVSRLELKKKQPDVMALW